MHRLAHVATAAGLLLAAVMISRVTLPAAWEHHALVFHLAMLVPSLLAVLLAWRLQGHGGSGTGLHRAWRILAVAFLCFLAAHSAQALAEWMDGPRILASTADALQLLFFVALLWGISAFQRAHRSAGDQNKYFGALVRHSSDVTTVIAPDTTVHYQSPSALRALGVSPASLIGTLYLERVHPDDRERLFTCIAQALQHPDTPTLAEWRIRHEHGNWLHFETYASNQQTDPVLQGIVMVSRDITERKVLEEELKFRAFHDSLTGLANRALFVNRVEQALVRTRRSRRGAALLFLDLDNFKMVNDLLGHAEGDRLLVEVASRLRRCIRATDTVARFGGDEFAILLEDMAHPADAALVAERVIRDLTIPIRSNGRDIVVSTSIGVAPVSGTETCDELMHHADSVMYLAKKHGRGRYEIFDAVLHSKVAQRLQLEADFHRALEMSEMVVHYRPVVSLGSHRIVAVEAVLRWHHPKRGLLEVEQFVDVARETEQLLPLCEWFMETACRQLRAWHLLYPGSAPISITVPLLADQLTDAQLTAKVRYTLQRTGIRPDTMVIEVPESAVAERTDEAAEQLLALKALGVRVAIAVQSSVITSAIRHLRRLPVDLLKLPSTSVAGIDSAEHGSTVSTLLALDATSTVKTVAEGVENGDQVERLQWVGFDMAQGPHFANPLRKEVIEGLLHGGAVLERPVAVASGV